jgi:hypothetical protein
MRVDYSCPVITTFYIVSHDSNMMEEGRGKKEEGAAAYLMKEEGRRKREEGRSSNAHYNLIHSNPFHLLYLLFLDLIFCTYE